MRDVVFDETCILASPRVLSNEYKLLISQDALMALYAPYWRHALHAFNTCSYFPTERLETSRSYIIVTLTE